MFAIMIWEHSAESSTIVTLILLTLGFKKDFFGVCTSTPQNWENNKNRCFLPDAYPRCSMYWIFTYIYYLFKRNVGKYTIHRAFGYVAEVLFEKSTEAEQSFARPTTFIHMLLVSKGDSLLFCAWLGCGFNHVFFHIHPYLGKRSNLTNIFQMDWNHQLDEVWVGFM